MDEFEVIKSVAKAVRAKGGWSYIENSVDVGESFTADGFTAKVVARKTDPGFPANGYDGAYEQGTEFEAFIVVEVDGKFFKKTGTGDSCGDVSWDGDLLPATQTEKVVYVYE